VDMDPEKRREHNREKAGKKFHKGDRSFANGVVETGAQLLDGKPEGGTVWQTKRSQGEQANRWNTESSGDS